MAPKTERAAPPAEPDTAPDIAPYSGLPMVTPQPGEDRVFHEIERHRAAVAAYNQAVETHYAAEDKVSEEEYEGLEAASSAACEKMMLFGKCVAIVTATTRRGLIHQANYLAAQFNGLEGCENGCMYMPERINGKPWPEVFMKGLAKQLRRMGPELEPERKPKRGGLLAASKAASAEDDPIVKAVQLLMGLKKKGMVWEAVKCLQALLTLKPSSSVAIVKNRPPNGHPVVSVAALKAEIDALDGDDRRYMEGYMQGMIDGRAS